MALRPVDLLAARLRGEALPADAWRRWRAGVRAGEVAPYHHAVMLVTARATPLTAAERDALDGDALPLPGLGDLLAPPAGAGGDGLAEAVAAKLRGEALSRAALGRIVADIASGAASDALTAALTAAIFLKGMDPSETAALTFEMTHTGDTLALPDLPGPVVDKHSTGGVGDKVSLPLTGVLAACGAFVPMISGRGLGHTGGTLDKMAAIPGLRVDLGAEEIVAIVSRVGAVIAGQTARLAPADKRMYALRDVTGTVASIPLITASILSKKLAEGLSALCMDVKVGSGAFMGDLDGATALARSIVDVGEALSQTGGGRPMRVRAVLTSMDAPLGAAIGNALEVRESIDCLRGGGPADLRALVVAIAARLLRDGGLSPTVEAGATRAAAALDDGSALARFRAMVVAQGGDGRAIDDPDRLPQAPVQGALAAPEDGVVCGLDALTLGRAVVALGGGRRAAEDAIDPAVGLTVEARLGDRVRAGDPILRIHARSEASLAEAREALGEGVRIGEGAAPAPLLLGEVP